MDNPEIIVHDRLNNALQQVSILVRAIESHERSKGDERLLSGARRLSRDIEQTLVQSRDAASGREALRRAADAASRRAALLFTLSPTPCIVIDRVGTILDANPAAVRLLNTSLRHLAGRSFHIFVSADREQFLRRLIALDGGDEPARWPIKMRPRERSCCKIMFTVVAEDSDQLLVMLLPADEVPHDVPDMIDPAQTLDVCATDIRE